MKQKFNNFKKVCYNDIIMPPTKKARPTAMKLQRVFTTPSVHVFDTIKWIKRDVKILGSDGSTVFEMKDVEVPEQWSQLATDVLASKFFKKAGVPGTGSEKSAKQIVYRIAKTLRIAGEEQGYFATKDDADIFEDELTYLLINQYAAFNSPVWFNCGLSQIYNIKGESIGNYYFNHQTGKIEQTFDGYTHPQLSACFIQSVKDDLMDIARLVEREMRIFKYGSGTGTNFSNLRAEGESLSGGGTSSGVMSFLEVFDRAAGATKSGGITRRAAKMVILDINHPEIERFIMWKAREEEKAQVLMQHGYSGEMDGEAYKTVSGQNSNNSVRVPDEFIQAVLDDTNWNTYYRVSKQIARTYKARELFKKIAWAAWRCADPGMQFATTINRWNTCKTSGEIRATNPCAEFIFLDDTACNLSSLNLLKFMQDDRFDVEKFCHAVGIMILAQEIIVDFASYPTKEIAQNSHDFRPLGLGFANLGALLMSMGLAYDSDEARAIAGAISAIMTGAAYRTSAQIASFKKPFSKYTENKTSMLEVIKMHQEHVLKIDEKHGPSYLLNAAKSIWDEVVKLGNKYGFRNAQVSCIAPTGTIGFLMDCDTTGIEPDFALVKMKKLAGGGYFKIVNNAVAKALKQLGYSQQEIQDILTYICGTGSFKDAPHINYQSLMEKKFTLEEIKKIEQKLPHVFELQQAFNINELSKETITRIGVDANSNDNLLIQIGFTQEQIRQASDYICGRMTIEGAPHLKEEHLAVFDCASKCGIYGKRSIHWQGHLKMLASVQPFISGGISKTVNLPAETTVEEVEKIYLEAWRLGLKVISIYRDGCKAAQPLTTGKREKPSRPQQLTLFELPTIKPRELPKERKGSTIEGKIGNLKIYIRTGEYEDGTLGEVFIDMLKAGSAFNHLLHCFAVAISFGLQYGVPLEKFVDAFTFVRFEPNGPVDHPHIKFCTSVVDYVFRVLGLKYLGRTDLAHIKPGTLTSEPVAVEHEPEKNIDTMLMTRFISSISSDSPPCSICGHLMTRSGTCYRCLNCGHQVGCG